MRLFRPVPRSVSRPLAAIVLTLWVVQMALLLRTIQASGVNFAGDLSRYGSSAQWRGVYSRGEKIGFMVGQVVPREGGYEIQEDGRLQMTLLGATSAARLHSVVRVDRSFEMQFVGRLSRIEFTCRTRRSATVRAPVVPAMDRAGFGQDLRGIALDEHLGAQVLVQVGRPRRAGKRVVFRPGSSSAVPGLLSRNHVVG